MLKMLYVVDRILFELIVDFIVILRELGAQSKRPVPTSEEELVLCFNILLETMQTRSRLQVSSSLHVYF
jgi:hypothetical protein